MCGIAGQINLDTAQPVDAAILQRMAAAIAHRGPDAEGLWTDGPAGLAHRRLSIIDLSEAANQPMSNEDGSVWIVYNGEIYNFLDLREHLARRGHVLRTRSDTEVLIHLYEDEGENMLARLRGMFAFAIWDVRRRRLFAARDRIGKKPFKYHLDRRRFVFASELKAILARGDVAAEIDDADIHQYLGFGYVFAPNTGYRGIQKLPPAHYLILENGRLRIERYWRLDYRNKTTLSYRDCQERILELLDEATRLRLISDVPLGAFLSGGVDSSAVVGFMARHASQPVRTFSIGFDFERLNELPYARQIAKRFSTDHTEHVVHARSAEVLPELVRLYEEPYADSSALPSYYLAQMTRREVTVALNGDGGDENFCGYDRYSSFWFFRNLAVGFGRARLGWTLPLLRALPGSFFHRQLQRAQLLHDWSLLGEGEAYGRHIAQLTDPHKQSLYRPEFQHWIRQRSNPAMLMERFAPAHAGRHPMDRMLLWDIENYLAEDLCPKMDIATMAHGLETRSPFLDHVFMEFCASIPAQWKLRRGAKKRILKDALGGIPQRGFPPGVPGCEGAPLLPRDILYRTKQGFGIPVQEWFRGELAPLCRETLLTPDARTARYLKPRALAALIESHVSGATQEGSRLWLLLTLELWLRRAG